MSNLLNGSNKTSNKTINKKVLNNILTIIIIKMHHYILL